MLTSKQAQQYIDQLEFMRAEIKAHYISIEDEQSIYNHAALSNIGKALDGINDALDGLRGEYR
jgi:hypothetical protein